MTEPRVTAAELQSGHFYVTSLEANAWEIIRVGPKWITYREWYAPFGTGKPRRGSERRTLRSGWSGPAFREVPRP